MSEPYHGHEDSVHDAHVPDEQYFAYVRCRGDSVPGQQPCGVVGLTMEQYEHQMNKPDSLWYCPRCGSSANYDDARSEKAQGLNDEETP